MHTIFLFENSEKIVRKIQDEFENHWKAGDAKGLTSHYHPDAVLIHQGNWVAYRQEEILKRYEEALKHPGGFKLIFRLTVPAADGEYIIHHGDFEFEAKPGVHLPYKQIYKKMEDGKYLIYHDIFEM